MAQSNGGFWADFQKFIMRGNVIDLAVAVVIGAAFGQIVTSFVEDIITPLILNPVLARLNLNDIQQLSINGIKYGVFLAAVLNFLVITLSIFLFIRTIEKARRRLIRKQEVEAEVLPPDPAIVAQQNLTAAIQDLRRVIESQRNL